VTASAKKSPRSGMRPAAPTGTTTSSGHRVERRKRASSPGTIARSKNWIRHLRSTIPKSFLRPGGALRHRGRKKKIYRRTDLISTSPYPATVCTTWWSEKIPCWVVLLQWIFCSRRPQEVRLDSRSHYTVRASVAVIHFWCCAGVERPSNFGVRSARSISE